MTCNKSDAKSIKIAADCLKAGGIAVLPTDTVYGFSGVATGDFSKSTAAKLRDLKGRGEDKPFIWLVAKPADIFQFTSQKIPEKILTYWPGALTVIANDVWGGTTAFRCPGDDWLRRVLEMCGQPIYSTSVNRSGQSAFWQISEIQTEFGNSVDLIVADGDKPHGVPSTILRLDDGKFSIVRQGAVVVDGS